MSVFEIARLIHFLSAAILFGTGVGIAFFMLMAWRTNNALHTALTARTVVLADYIFTSTAVIVQPISGYVLIRLAGHDPFAPWLIAVYALYVLTGAFWLPVVWIQLRVRRIAEDAVQSGNALSAEFHKLMRIWFVLGWPAFFSVGGIYILMILKPDF